MQSMGEKPRES